MVHASLVIQPVSINHPPLVQLLPVGGFFVMLLREGRKAAEIAVQIPQGPALLPSEKALPLGWQMPGTGRSTEISVYLIFSPPFTLDFFTALCSQNAKAANQCSVTLVNWAV